MSENRENGGFQSTVFIDVRQNNCFTSRRFHLAKYVSLKDFQHLQFYPQSLKLNCGAVAGNSMIFGPDGAMYKCSNEVGFHDRSHDHLHTLPTDGKKSLPVLQITASSPNVAQAQVPHDYMAYDPFSNPSCSKCKYLPVCLGGCPKAQMEDNRYFIDSYKRFWDASLDPMITAFADSLVERGLLSQAEAIETPFSQKLQEERREIA